MTHGREHWTALAKSSDADDLREHILTGYKSGKPFTPYIPTLDLPRPIGRALDFGCGLGRSFSYLKTIATHVTGFDLPPMVERCRALAPQPADALLDNWAEARVERFDLIYSALVLQHIETDACRAYLEDFARMAPVVYLLTRTMSDFEVNVLDLAASTGLFDAGECVEVDHDPATNQLRVLGRRALENVRRSPEPGHYEVMLSSRVG